MNGGGASRKSIGGRFFFHGARHVRGGTETDGRLPSRHILTLGFFLGQGYRERLDGEFPLAVILRPHKT